MKNLSYPRCYQPRDLLDQIEIIKQIVPINVNKNLVELVMQSPLPDGAEGMFVVPKMKESYSQSITEVLSIIEKKRKFYSHLTTESKKFRRDKKTADALELLSYAQKDLGDIIILPAQFGKRHLNKSVNSVRKELAPNEFGLGLHEVSWMILTHPERQNSINGIHIDCPGDTYSSIYSPYFDYGHKWMELSIRESKRSVHDIGSVTGFLTNGRRI